MREEYKYSIANDINNKKFNIISLEKEIIKTLNSSTLCEGICQKGDEIIVIFSESLDNSEKTNLDQIIANHDVNTYIQRRYSIPFYPANNIISETSYTSVGSFTLHYGCEICSIDIISRMSNGAISYDILILNHDLNFTIAEQNFTNTDVKSSSFSVINNNLNNNSEFDTFIVKVYAKINKNGNAVKNVFIDNIMFWMK